jgi:DNA-directed RNA polymerase subunit RPC12/RpoP
MTEPEADKNDEVWGRLRKRCPHCGAWSQTLGSVCSECGKSFTPLGLLDRIPFPGNDTLSPVYAGPLYLFAGIALLAFLVVLFVTNWQAATVLVAGLFILLVAAIGVTNWMARR